MACSEVGVWGRGSSWWHHEEAGSIVLPFIPITSPPAQHELPHLEENILAFALFKASSSKLLQPSGC